MTFGVFNIGVFVSSAVVTLKVEACSKVGADPSQDNRVALYPASLSVSASIYFAIAL